MSYFGLRRFLVNHASMNYNRFRKENMQYCHICNDHDPFTFHECHPNFHLIIIRGIFLSDKIVFSISNFLEYFTQQSQDNVSPFFYFQPKKQML